MSKSRSFLDGNDGVFYMIRDATPRINNLHSTTHWARNAHTSRKLRQACKRVVQVSLRVRHVPILLDKMCHRHRIEFDMP